MAEVIYIADMSQTVENYIESIINEHFPDVDTTQGSSTRDNVLNPIREVLVPFIEHLGEVELKMNLDNAEFMSESDLDEIGEGNHFISRREGNSSSGSVVLSFTSISDDEMLLIARGLVVSTDDGIQFQTTQDFRYSAEEALTHFNEETLMYEIKAPVGAVESGSMSDVASGKIRSLETPFHEGFHSVTNPFNTIGGTDQETNVEYAMRIRTSKIGQNGNTSGYKRMVSENFPEVSDIYVSGKDDRFMERDLVRFFDKEDKEFVGHMGGMVDIYIKGMKLDEGTLTLNCNTPNIELAHDTAVDSTIAIRRASDEHIDPVPYTVVTADNMKKTVTITAPFVDDNYIITYDYKLPNGVGASEEIMINVGKTTGVLKSPLESILSIRNKRTDKSYEVIGEDITHNVRPTSTLDAKETTRETNEIDLLIKEPNGTPIEIRYIYNKTINGLSELIISDEERIITTDVLAKKAVQKNVNIALSVKTKDGKKITQDLDQKIFNCLSMYFSALSLGDSVEESFIIHALMSDDSVSQDIAYFDIPLTSFYVTGNISEPVEVGRRTTSRIKCTAIEYASLNKIKIGPAV